MRYIQINFIDELFGESIEVLIIWDDEEFIIISIQEEEIIINKYNDMEMLIKEFIANKKRIGFFEKFNSWTRKRNW